MGKALTKDDTYGLMIPSTGYPILDVPSACDPKRQGSHVGRRSDNLFRRSSRRGYARILEILSGEHGIMPTGTVEWGTLRQAFLEGQTAMMWHSTGNLTAVKNNAKFDFGVAELPANVRLGSPTGGGNFYLFKDTTDEEKAAALKLMQVHDITRASRSMVHRDRLHGCFPRCVRNRSAQGLHEEFPPALVARNQLENAVAEFSTFETARVRDGLNSAIQSALTGSKEAADALGEAQAAAVRLLRDLPVNKP